jgi:uncharacterized membrane protein YbhN (UPF0104 family)
VDGTTAAAPLLLLPDLQRTRQQALELLIRYSTSGGCFVPAEEESGQAPGVPVEKSASPSSYGDVKKKLLRGGIVVGVLVAVAAGIMALLPGLGGLRSAIQDASLQWIIAAACLQAVGVAGAVVFVQFVFADVPERLTWKMGGAQQAANAVMPTAGSTAVSYWTLTSIGWGAARFAERTAVMIIAPAAPNFLLLIFVGFGMGFGLFAGPDNPWLTFLPAAIAALIIVVALLAAKWGHRLAARTDRKWLREGLHVMATGVTGTVEILRRRNWRVLGTWVELFAAIGALWASLIAVAHHTPLAVVAMAWLLGQFMQVIPIPGGIGAIDAGVAGALVLYGTEATAATAAQVIAHGLALLIPLLAGSIAFALLPREIKDTRDTGQRKTASSAAAGG